MKVRFIASSTRHGGLPCAQIEARPSTVVAQKTVQAVPQPRQLAENGDQALPEPLQTKNHILPRKLCSQTMRGRCSRGFHIFSLVRSFRGWYTCSSGKHHTSRACWPIAAAVGQSIQTSPQFIAVPGNKVHPCFVRPDTLNPEDWHVWPCLGCAQKICLTRGRNVYAAF